MCTVIAPSVQPSPIDERRDGPNGSVLIIGCIILVLAILAIVVLTGSHRLLFLGVVVTVVATLGLLAYLGVRMLLKR